MKNNRIIIGALLAVFAALAACAPIVNAGGGKPAAVEPQQPAHTITVSGSGQVSIVPDIAYINVGVHSQADSVAEALALNNSQAKTIKETLMGEGVAELDIQTSSFNVYPQSEYDFQGAITRTFYSVDNSVYLTVRNLDDLGKLLDAVVRSGANNIYGITFDVQDKTVAQSTARKLAVDSAKKQAQELAAAAGVELGEIISISTFTSYPQTYFGMGGGGGAEMASSVPIAAGQLQLTSEVTMSFAIVQ